MIGAKCPRRRRLIAAAAAWLRGRHGLVITAALCGRRPAPGLGVRCKVMLDRICCSRRRVRHGAVAVLAVAIVTAAAPALADFRVCNKTGSRIGLAVGYKEGERWTTEGWWNVAANSCETLMSGPLVARFYYIYGVDYDRGGEWAGKAFMCTRDKEFTIRGIEDCLARGYDRTGFFEVDTGEQKNWTVQLTDAMQSSPALNSQAAPR
jgi:uncharacterized membrane protein